MHTRVTLGQTHTWPSISVKTVFLYLDHRHAFTTHSSAGPSKRITLPPPASLKPLLSPAPLLHSTHVGRSPWAGSTYGQNNSITYSRYLDTLWPRTRHLAQLQLTHFGVIQKTTQITLACGLLVWTHGLVVVWSFVNLCWQSTLSAPCLLYDLCKMPFPNLYFPFRVDLYYGFFFSRKLYGDF